MATTVPSRAFSRLITDLEQDLGLSSLDLAGATGVSQDSIERWRNGEQPQGEALKRLDALAELRGRLDETFKTMDGARAWLHHENEYLLGTKPIDAIRAGQPGRVHNALEVIDSGIYL